MKNLSASSLSTSVTTLPLSSEIDGSLSRNTHTREHVRRPAALPGQEDSLRYDEAAPLRVGVGLQEGNPLQPHLLQLWEEVELLDVAPLVQT